MTPPTRPGPRGGKRTLTALVAVGATVSGASALHGQGIEVNCGTPSAVDRSDPALGPASPLARLHPDTARARLAGLVERREWVAAVDSLRGWLRATEVGAAAAAGPDAGAAPARAAVLLAQLDTLAMLVDGRTVAAAEALRGGITDFNPMPEPPDAFVIFGSEPAPILVERSDPEPVQRALCWTALSASDLLGRYRRPELDALRARIRRALAEWTAYNESGRSQYPWELWLNGFRSDPLELSPPRTQWVVLHPWVGLEARGLDRARLDDLGALTRATVVPVDLLGVIRYADGYRRYLGASAALSLGPDGSRGGLILHLSNGVSIGPTWERVGWPDGALFTVDFYHLLAGLPAVQQAVVETLAGALQPDPPGTP